MLIRPVLFKPRHCSGLKLEVWSWTEYWQCKVWGRAWSVCCSFSSLFLFSLMGPRLICGTRQCQQYRLGSYTSALETDMKPSQDWSYVSMNIQQGLDEVRAVHKAQGSTDPCCQLKFCKRPTRWPSSSDPLGDNIILQKLHLTVAALASQQDRLIAHYRHFSWTAFQACMVVWHPNKAVQQQVASCLNPTCVGKRNGVFRFSNRMSISVTLHPMLKSLAVGKQYMVIGDKAAQ